MAVVKKTPGSINDKMLTEIRRKAESGINLDVVTPEKQKIYDQHQSFIRGEIARKAQSGIALDRPNEWKMGLYNQALPKAPDPNQMINDLYNQQKQAQLAQLKASRDKATGQLNQQRAELAPQYQGMRNQSDVAAQQGAQRLREIMAANGLSASGENVSANVALQSQRQQNLNSLNLQEQQQNNDISRRIADLNNPAEENALIAALEAERARAMLGQFNTDRQFGLQEGGLLGNYNGQRTLAGQGFDADQLWRGKEFDSNEFWRGVNQDNVEWDRDNLTAYEKAQIEQQNKSRASSRANSYQSGYEKAYEEFMKQMAEKEYLDEIQRLRQEANAVTNRRNIPSNPLTNYRPQY